MSEKVKITQEQAGAIEFLKKQYNDVVIAKTLFTHENNWTDKMNCLNKSDTDTLLRALYNGYEVEPEFKVGDWVVYELSDGNKIREVIEISFGSHVYAYWGSLYELTWIDDLYLRHATPEEIAKEKERRWWDKHGREPWELKEDDVLTRNDDGFPWFVGKKRDSLPGYYLDGEHFNLEDIRNNYRVMVFVHDRKDVDHE